MEVIAEFKACQDCGAEAWLMQSVLKKWIDEGMMSKDTIPCYVTEVICNVDPKKPPIAGGRIPGARVYKDFCIKCGRVQTTRMEKGFVIMPTRQGMPITFV